MSGEGTARAGLESTLSGLEERSKTPLGSQGDRTSEVVGTHPFPVRIFGGSNKDLLYVADARNNFSEVGCSIFSKGVERRLGDRMSAIKRVLARVSSNNYPQTVFLARLIDPTRDQIEFALKEQSPLSSRDNRTLLELKSYLDDARMMVPDKAIRAAMEHLAENDYRWLVQYINHVLTNKGKNPRAKLPKKLKPIRDVNEIKRIDLWFVKEGKIAYVFQATVELVGSRPSVKLAINIAKDLTDAAEAIRRIHAVMVEDYRWYPGGTVEPYGLGAGRVNTRFGIVEVPVQVSEWAGGSPSEEEFHELHWYPNTKWLVHAWLHQVDKRNALSVKESNQIWQEIIKLQTIYSRIQSDKTVMTGFSLNAGDFVGRRRPGGMWEVLAVWNQGRGPSEEIDPVAVVVNGLTQAAPNDDSRQVAWWDHPSLAIPAVLDGLLEQARYRASAESRDAATAQEQALVMGIRLLKQARDEALPQLLKDPEPLLPRVQGSKQHQSAVRVVRQARGAIGRFLKVGLEELPSGEGIPEPARAGLEEILSGFKEGAVEVIHPQALEGLDLRGMLWDCDGTLTEGIGAFLLSLNEADVRMAIATAANYDSRDQVLREPGIRDFFAGIRAGGRKVQDIEQQARKWKLKPHQLAFIGDHVNDVKTAQDAGVLAIAYAQMPEAREQFLKLPPEDQPDVIIHGNFLNLDEILRTLLGSRAGLKERDFMVEDLEVMRGIINSIDRQHFSFTAGAVGQFQDRVRELLQPMQRSQNVERRLPRQHFLISKEVMDLLLDVLAGKESQRSILFPGLRSIAQLIATQPEGPDLLESVLNKQGLPFAHYNAAAKTLTEVFGGRERLEGLTAKGKPTLFQDVSEAIGNALFEANRDKKVYEKTKQELVRTDKAVHFHGVALEPYQVILLGVHQESSGKNAKKKPGVWHLLLLADPNGVRAIGEGVHVKGSGRHPTIYVDDGKSWRPLDEKLQALIGIDPKYDGLGHWLSFNFKDNGPPFYLCRLDISRSGLEEGLTSEESVLKEHLLALSDADRNEILLRSAKKAVERGLFIRRFGLNGDEPIGIYDLRLRGVGGSLHNINVVRLALERVSRSVRGYFFSMSPLPLGWELNDFKKVGVTTLLDVERLTALDLIKKGFSYEEVLVLRRFLEKKGTGLKPVRLTKEMPIEVFFAVTDFPDEHLLYEALIQGKIETVGAMVGLKEMALADLIKSAFPHLGTRMVYADWAVKFKQFFPRRLQSNAGLEEVPLPEEILEKYAKRPLSKEEIEKALGFLERSHGLNSKKLGGLGTISIIDWFSYEIRLEDTAHYLVEERKTLPSIPMTRKVLIAARLAGRLGHQYGLSDEAIDAIGEQIQLYLSRSLESDKAAQPELIKELEARGIPRMEAEISLIEADLLLGRLLPKDFRKQSFTPVVNKEAAIALRHGAGLEEQGTTRSTYDAATLARTLLDALSRGDYPLQSGDLAIPLLHASRLLGGSPTAQTLHRNPFLLDEINAQLRQAFKIQGSSVNQLRKRGMTGVHIQAFHGFDAPRAAQRLLSALATSKLTSLQPDEEGRLVLSFKEASRLMQGFPDDTTFSRNAGLVSGMNATLQRAFEKSAPDSKHEARTYACWKIAQRLTPRGMTHVEIKAFTGYDPASVADRLLDAYRGAQGGIPEGDVTVAYKTASRLLGGRPSVAAFSYAPDFVAAVNAVLDAAFREPEPDPQKDPNAHERWAVARALIEERKITGLRVAKGLGNAGYDPAVTAGRLLEAAERSAPPLTGRGKAGALTLSLTRASGLLDRKPFFTALAKNSKLVAGINAALEKAFKEPPPDLSVDPDAYKRWARAQSLKSQGGISLIRLAKQSGANGTNGSGQWRALSSVDLRGLPDKPVKVQYRLTSAEGTIVLQNGRLTSADGRTIAVQFKNEKHLFPIDNPYLDIKVPEGDSKSGLEESPLEQVVGLPNQYRSVSWRLRGRLAGTGLEELPAELERRLRSKWDLDVQGPLSVPGAAGASQIAIGVRWNGDSVASLPDLNPVFLVQAGVFGEEVMVRLRGTGWPIMEISEQVSPGEVMEQISAVRQMYADRPLLVIVKGGLEEISLYLPKDEKINLFVFPEGMVDGMSPESALYYLFSVAQKFPGGRIRMDYLIRAGMEEVTAVSTQL